VHEEDRLAELRAQAVGGEIGFASRQRAVVDHQPGGLVHDGEEVVAMQDRKIQRVPRAMRFRNGASRDALD
jgi:hypothetical protein